MKKTVGLKSLSTIPLMMLYLYVSCNMVMNCIFTVLEMSFKGSLTSGFFHKSVSPGPLSISLGSFRIFSKIRGDIRE